jgi:hypothetical protein
MGIEDLAPGGAGSAPGKFQLRALAVTAEATKQEQLLTTKLRFWHSFVEEA